MQPPAAADGDDATFSPPPGSGNPVLDVYADEGSLMVEVSDAAGAMTIVGPRLPAWLLACTWSTFDRLSYELFLWSTAAFPGEEPTAESLEAVGLDPDEVWAVVFCDAGPEVQAFVPGLIDRGILSAWPVGGAPPEIVQDWIVASAVAAVEIPVQVGQSAPFGDAAAPIITQLPTWGWADASVWSRRSASNPPVFGTVATATATPYRLVFEGAAGLQVDCGANEGPAYDFGLSEEEQSSECTLLYEHSSSVGDFALTSTIYWEISWVCNQYCGAGTLDIEFVITNTRTVRVAELQAIGTSIGSE